MDNNDNTNQTITEADLENLSEEQLLDLFIEQMLIDKGLDNLEGEARNEVRSELKEQLMFEINRSIIAALPDDKFKELSDRMDKGEVSADDITKAVDEANINVDDITEQTMLKFRELYLAGSEASTDQPSDDNNEGSAEE